MPPSRRERVETLFLLLNLAALAALYAWLLVPILRDGAYMPAWTDEYGYVLDARSFAANGTLHAARVKEERVSRAFEASTHGPAYILLQGGIARAFGDPVAISLWPNVVALAFAMVLVLAAFPLERSQRLWIAVLLLLHFAVLLYALTWMVETYQVLFAIVASLLLTTLYRSERASRRFRATLVGYGLLLLVLSTFRVSYALWALGLIPLARDRRELLRFGALSLLLLVAGIGIMQQLSASNPNWPLSRAAAALSRGDAAGAMALVLHNVTENAQRYLIGETQGLRFYVAMKYAVLAIGLVLLVGGVRRDDRLALATCMILAAHLALLLLLYDAVSWREHRHLAPVFYLAIVALVAGRQRSATYALYVLMLLLLPEVVGYAHARILPERQWMARQWGAAGPARAALAELAQLDGREGGGPITVLHAQGFYRNLSLFPLAVPVTNHAGRPIRYTGNLGRTPDTMRFGRLPIDYVLLPPGAAPEPGWTLVHEDRFYVLYDLRSASGAGTGSSPSPRSSASDR
ncbi:hypothetical protein K2Z84_25145 [Candidatus Binatia bacterium]|nr:hypothetical protein [Candidatus Binatia bacterium]